MAVWDELKVVLVRLRDEQPGALMQSPTLDVDEGPQPPFTIRLAPPPAGRGPMRPRAARPPADPLDPHEITAQLDGPAVVRSGRTLHHGLLPAPPHAPAPPRARPRAAAPATRHVSLTAEPRWRARHGPAGRHRCRNEVHLTTWLPQRRRPDDTPQASRLTPVPEATLPPRRRCHRQASEGPGVHSVRPAHSA